MKKLQKGFTLIELMIVVAIIAILAAVAAPKFGQQIKKSKDAKGLAIVGNWRSASQLYYADNEKYSANGFAELKAHVDDSTIKATSTGNPTGTTATTPVADGDLTMTYSATSDGAITISGPGVYLTGSTTKKWADQ